MRIYLLAYAVGCNRRRHEAEHLFELDLIYATDTEIWRRAKVENLVIVSKDVDFLRPSAGFGSSTAGRPRVGGQL